MPAITLDRLETIAFLSCVTLGMEDGPAQDAVMAAIKGRRETPEGATFEMDEATLAYAAEGFAMGWEGAATCTESFSGLEDPAERVAAKLGVERPRTPGP